MKEKIILIGYAIGMLGTLLGALVFATIVVPSKADVQPLWPFGLAAMTFFILMWACSIWQGMREGWMKPRYSLGQIKRKLLNQ